MREENKDDRRYQADERGKMVPMEFLAREEEEGEKGEYRQSDHLLDHFELKQGERTAISAEPQSVCRNHETVFEQGYSPGEDYDGIQWPICWSFSWPYQAMVMKTLETSRSEIVIRANFIMV